MRHSSLFGDNFGKEAKMRVTRDNTGRFPERPFYTERELDQLFERIVTEFLRRRRGAVGFPLTTNELSILVEEHVSDLDLYADLALRR